MEYERSFDEADGFSRLEITAISIGVIKPTAPVFYRPVSPRCQYEDGKKLTKEAEEATQEAIREAERIHKKYHS